MGTASGEYIAACCCRLCLSLPDAVRLVAAARAFNASTASRTAGRWRLSAKCRVFWPLLSGSNASMSPWGLDNPRQAVVLSGDRAHFDDLDRNVLASQSRDLKASNTIATPFTLAHGPNA